MSVRCFPLPWGLRKRLPETTKGFTSCHDWTWTAVLASEMPPSAMGWNRLAVQQRALSCYDVALSAMCYILKSPKGLRRCHDFPIVGMICQEGP